ncbi:MAG: hypothetical protein QGG34_12525 [SAR202 cluster bacterium]|nr:hypothetical protein [SAR202 cluster bacterium]MDP6301066.1 hypothetical protein [SAR202 cluster bacterium]MDP7104067.1 hypothetical protein [SAR202 cluster bacterium]MDP7225679.1 hypothetical protein [SAR202 cluster bacterium]
MIRSFNSLDIVRSALASTRGLSNRAVTLSSLPRHGSYWRPIIRLSRLQLTPRALDSAWAWTEGAQLHGIAVVAPRSGLQSWEVTSLHLASVQPGPLSELLEEAAGAAAMRGAERIFLRLQDDDLVVDAARKSGFFPCVGETLLRGAAIQNGTRSGSLFDDATRLRRMVPRDDYGLFRLHNASVPVSVRRVTGMTFDQWRASQESQPGRRLERVFEKADAIRGWVRTSKRGGAGYLSAALHADDRAIMPDVVDSGLRRLAGARDVYCLTPEYETSLQAALDARRFVAVDHFVTLVKTTGKTAAELQRGRSALASIE